jgi:hypothetical protein
MRLGLIGNAWGAVLWLLLALVPLPSLARNENSKTTSEAGMQSQHYQLIKVSQAMPPPGSWDKADKSLVIDLLSFKGRLDAAPEPVKRYVAQLTSNFTKSVFLRDVLKRDDVVYYSDYWTNKGSVLNIVEYRKTGSSTDLTPYLGPLSSITTSTYGFAKYHFHYKGEVLPFWGIAQKDKWSLRKRYWAHAQVFMPFDESAGLDIAVIGMSLGTNQMEAVGTLILLPKDFQ